MKRSMETCLRTLELGNAFFLEKIAKMDDAAVRERVAGEVNPIIWLAGHLLLSRNYLLGLFGKARDLAFESKFTSKYDPAAEYPSMATLESAWIDVSDALLKHMRKASDDHFSKRIDWNIPNGDKTVRGAVLFYTYHEGWHMGQIAYARKGMGMDGLVPF